MTRIARAWAQLESEQRLAAATAVVLMLTLLLPWYSKTVTIVVGNAARADQTSLSGIGAMSFVEAAVLLVSAGVLALLFARAERRDFRMPGSDGAVVAVAGGWAAVLIFYRLLDKPGLTGTQKVTATVGVEWGIFFALIAACAMAYAGWRMRAAAEPEPPLLRRRRRGGSERHDAERGEHRPRPAAASQTPSSEEVTVVTPAAATPAAATPSAVTPAARRRPRYPPAPAEQLSFEDQPAEPDPR